MYDIACILATHLKVWDYVGDFLIVYTLLYECCQNCKMCNHLSFFVFKKNAEQNFLENITLAVPAFHCYGHKAACQVIIQSIKNALILSCNFELYSKAQNYCKIL